MVDRLEGHVIRDPHDLHAKVEVQLDQAAAEVTRRLADTVSYEVVREAVVESYEQLAARAKVHGFLPILAARSAQQRLMGTR
ncbi:MULTISPECIES: three-helix bundle dimerization domain-containing protein [unclassified Saccharothrix]|uniref:three-helix bundle dimerization domain-containing protein n=1 Tax=unclassified Saccharothrix TaxID=2593673 RepID=UPI00307DB0F0